MAEPLSPISPQSLVSLGYDNEQRVLELMLQGRSNLAIVNHYKVQDLRLTLEQVQRVRELAGIEPTSASKKVPNESHSSGLHGESAMGVVARRRAAPPCGDAQCDTVTLQGHRVIVPPEFKRTRSDTVSGAARAVSSCLVAPLRNRGWQGTFVALGIYFICIYLCFLAVAHLVVSFIHWMLAHKLITVGASAILGWTWYAFAASRQAVRVRLSDPARQALDSYASQFILAALVAIRDVIEYVHTGGKSGESRVESEDEQDDGVEDNKVDVRTRMSQSASNTDSPIVARPVTPQRRSPITPSRPVEGQPMPQKVHNLRSRLQSKVDEMPINKGQMVWT